MITKRNKIWHAVIHISPTKQKWISTQTGDKRKAQRIHDHLVAEIQTIKKKERYSSFLADIADSLTKQTISSPGYPLEDVWQKFSDLQEQPPSKQKKYAWNKFTRWIEHNYPICTTINDITRRIALSYMDTFRKLTPKTFNNNKGHVSIIFKALMIYADIAENPFDLIPARSADSKPYRNYSDNEVQLILDYTKGTFWHDITLLAYHTGLRKKDISLLKWEDLHDDIIKLIPAKTKRNKKAVIIPLHNEAFEIIKNQKRTSIYVFAEAAKQYKSDTQSYRSAFGKILKALEIKENTEGQVGFHSLRSTFVTNCEESGIPRHIIMGIVGHGSSAMTKLYSHDIQSAKIIQKLKSLKALKT